MRISPKAELETIKPVYKMLVARLQPDNAETGDAEAFMQLRRGFEVSSDPAVRAAYDAEYIVPVRQPAPSVEPSECTNGVHEPPRGHSVRALQTSADKSGEIRLVSSGNGAGDKGRTGVRICQAVVYAEQGLHQHRRHNSDFVITPAGIDSAEANLPETAAKKRTAQPLACHGRVAFGAIYQIQVAQHGSHAVRSVGDHVVGKNNGFGEIAHGAS